MGTVVRRRPGVGGDVCFRIPPPPGGYDYSRSPSNFPRPVGNQPPIHAADPLKRCQNCNELGHVHQYCAWRIDPGQSRPPAGATSARPSGPPAGISRQSPWKHSYGQADVAAAPVQRHAPPVHVPDIAAADTDAPTYYYDDDYDDYGDYYYEQPAPEDYGYVDYQNIPTPPPQYQQPAEYYNYAQHQQPPPPPQTQQPHSIHAPFPSSSPASGASSSPPSQLNLLTARSVPQRESELNPIFGRVGCAGLALASQPPREAVWGRTVGPVGREL